MRKSKNLIALLLIVVSLLSASLNAQAVVLCVGADGHTALEAAISGVCGDTQSADSWSAGTTSRTAASVPTIEELHCGPCQDLAALSKANARRLENLEDKRTIVTPGLPVARADSLSWLPKPSDTAIDRKQLSQHSPSSSLEFLRTIVLLI